MYMRVMIASNARSGSARRAVITVLAPLPVE
jgi:hypothetical protein